MDSTSRNEMSDNPNVITMPPVGGNPRTEKEKIYEEEIAPLLRQIHKVCQEHRIAMVTTFALGLYEKDGKTGFLVSSTVNVDHQDPENPPDFNALAEITQTGFAGLMAKYDRFVAEKGLPRFNEEDDETTH
jgi:hypothetical protein